MDRSGSLREVDRLISHLAIPALVLDEAANIIQYNAAAEEYLGATFDDRGVLQAPSWPAELKVRTTDHEALSLDELQFWINQPPARRGSGRARFNGLDGREHYVRLLATELLDADDDGNERTLILFWNEEEHSFVTDRRLATVVYTDLVQSTVRATELGDATWVKLLEAHDQMVRKVAGDHGQLVNTTGDGALLTFESPAQAIAFGRAFRDRVRSRRLELRVGIHSGEVELTGGGIGGIAAHIGARVLSAAQPGEILVSRTVVDLVAGSGIEFEDRGEHELKGVTGTWRLYAVAD